MSFAAADEGGEDHYFIIGIIGEHTFVDLVFSVLDHLFACDIGVCFAGAGVQEAQEVIDLGDRTDGRPWIPTGCFLFDADDGAEAVDFFYIGAFYAAEKLAGVGGESFEIAALAFGVDGIEGEGGFAAAADAGDDDEFFAWDFEIDAFEVVFSGADDFDPGIFIVGNTIFFRDGHFWFKKGTKLRRKRQKRQKGRKAEKEKAQGAKEAKEAQEFKSPERAQIIERGFSPFRTAEWRNGRKAEKEKAKGAKEVEKAKEAEEAEGAKEVKSSERAQILESGFSPFRTAEWRNGRRDERTKRM